jgi:hypothetical protein
MRTGVLAFCLAVTPVLAGCASEPNVPPEQEGVRLELPTSDWKLGEAGNGAQISGVLRVDPQGCVFLDSKDGGLPRRRLTVVWPAGFTAYVDAGEVRLYGPEDDVVAVEGDAIETGGGYGRAEPGSIPQDCVPDGEEIGYVAGDVRVVTDDTP